MHMKKPAFLASVAIALLLMAGAATFADEGNDSQQKLSPTDSGIRDYAARQVREGREIFRFDTFGSEAFWGGSLHLHQTVATLSPRAALSLGLKVDAAALPDEIVAAVKNGTVNLDDPAATSELLKLNAVVGVKGFFGQDGKLESVGIQCALCHSTVDRSFSTRAIPPGNIGNRLDG
jgi:hypothetical protein